MNSSDIVPIFTIVTSWHSTHIPDHHWFPPSYYIPIIFWWFPPSFPTDFPTQWIFPGFHRVSPMIPSDSHHVPHIFARKSGRFSAFPPPKQGHSPSFQVHPAVAAHDQNVLAQHRGGCREARRGQLRARKPALEPNGETFLGGSGTSYPAWSTFTSWKDPPFWMGKSINYFYRAMFNSFLCVYQRV